MTSRATRESIVINDLSAAQPASALSNRPIKGCWYAMDYEPEKALKGSC